MFGRRTIKKIRGFRKREIKIVNKPIYENPYFRKTKPHFILRILKGPKRVILGLLFLGAVYFFFYSQFFRIDAVEIQGTQELTYDRVRYEINKAFVVRRFIIFRQSNIIIYNAETQEKTLREALALNEIKIKKKFPRKLAVSLKEKIPNLTFISKEKYYYLDLNGTVSHEVTAAEVKPHFPKVEDLNERKVKLNDRIFTEKIVQAIFKLQEDFAGKTNTTIERFLIPELNCPVEREVQPQNKNTNESLLNNSNNNINRTTVNLSSNRNKNENNNINKNTNSIVVKEDDCELAPLTQDIIAKTIEGWQAFFTTTESIALQLERLKVYLLRLALDEKSRENIDYIDLRFGEKIYVKEK